MEEGGTTLYTVTVYQYGKKLFKGKDVTDVEVETDDGAVTIILHWGDDAFRKFYGHGLACDQVAY